MSETRRREPHLLCFFLETYIHVYTVVGTALSRADKTGLVKLDLTDSQAVETFIQDHNPDVVVHCAAERRPDVAEKDHEGTLKLNVQVPRTLATLCKARNAMLVYISTDYVFDGTSPPYQVDDKPNPLNFYGKSKLGGEEAVREVDPQAVILRVPVLYGVTEYNGESAVNILLDVIKNRSKECDMDNFGLRYPTHVEDIARVIKDMSVKRIQQGDSNISGTFHYSGEEMYTKYTMCETFAKILNSSIDHIRPQNEISSSAATSRPKDAHLSNDRLKQVGIDTKHVPFEQWWTTYLTSA
ncbi:RmlD-like substrate binding domain-containing protein [Zychaea mexicana]|uniref:RmlD-like substrate binding domain-containing protein n=1 Tax=Zychaea mexicana TaxID=64656 RepID=UPI0022FEF265|nr:RmlD-like substrate binding domain-containing protein [Zychaea mexicana]KAI9489002.1 RmlD-like substrate binding domain-containing protein [Zychaea mexicana]